jgi:hypothetical protein
MSGELWVVLEEPLESIEVEVMEKVPHLWKILGKMGITPPSILSPPPKKHMQGWRVLPTYSVSTSQKHEHR